MTKFQALVVLFLRVKCDGSWRWVASKYRNRYLGIPFSYDGSYVGNQIDGMILCEQASKVLNIELY